MPPFGVPGLVFRPERGPAMGQSGRNSCLTGISLTPLAWSPLVVWSAGEAPERSDRRQGPPA